MVSCSFLTVLSGTVYYCGVLLCFVGEISDSPPPPPQIKKNNKKIAGCHSPLRKYFLFGQK